MTRKLLTALLAFMILVTGSFGSYAWWSRRTPPSFAQGGAFGMAPSPASSSVAPPRSQPASAKTASAKRSAARASASAPARARTTSPTASAGARRSTPARPPSGTANPPATGRYAYAGHGSERIEMDGGSSPCSWDIKDVSAVVKKDSGKWVYDWTYSEEHVERMILDIRTDGVYLLYTGASVVCAVRNNVEDNYTPPTRRIALPLKVGNSWTSVSETSSRTSSLKGKVLAKETVRVPAGSFEVYKVQVDLTLSGGQSGTYSITEWYSPALGMPVKHTVKADIAQDGTHFKSDYSFDLTDLP